VSARSVLGRFVRQAGPDFIRFVAYFGILGLVAMGGLELVRSLQKEPSALALGLRTSIDPSGDDIVLVQTDDSEWSEATGGIGLRETLPGDVPMVPSPYLLQ
jgi:hypothetical protein